MLYHWDGEQVRTYKAWESQVKLSPGDQIVELQPELAETWVLSGLIVTSEELPKTVAVEDVQAGVRLPPVQVEDTTAGGRFTIPNVPVGRFFYLRLQDQDDQWSDPLTFCPVFMGQPTHMERTFDLDAGTCHSN